MARKESNSGRKHSPIKDPRTAADGKHRQNGGHPDFVERGHCGIHGEWLRSGTG